MSAGDHIPRILIQVRPYLHLAVAWTTGRTYQFAPEGLANAFAFVCQDRYLWLDNLDMFYTEVMAQWQKIDDSSLEPISHF